MCEYTLLVCLEHQDQRVATLDKLHENILDAFNEYGVQITSPNYEADPGAAKVCTAGALVRRACCSSRSAVADNRSGDGVGVQATSLSLVVALCWVLPFAFGGRVQLGGSRSRRAWLSAAGGSAIAYVFIDLLPEMQHMQERFSTAAAGRAFPFPHYRVYTSALAGFLLFYALEHIVAASRPSAEGQEREEGTAVYWLQVTGFAVYCGLMAYLLREDADSRALSMVPYGIAMFCHLWIVDHALRSEHGRRYDESGRWVVGGGVLAGWTVAALGLSSDLLLPTLMGFIAGGVVLNSIKGELPEEGEARVGPFVAGAVGYALLLLLLD